MRKKAHAAAVFKKVKTCPPATLFFVRQAGKKFHEEHLFTAYMRGN